MWLSSGEVLHCCGAGVGHLAEHWWNIGSEPQLYSSPKRIIHKHYKQALGEPACSHTGYFIFGLSSSWYVTWSHSHNLYLEHRRDGLQKEVQQVSVRHKAEVLVVGGISRAEETCSTCPGQILSDLKSGNETFQSNTTQCSSVCWCYTYERFSIPLLLDKPVLVAPAKVQCCMCLQLIIIK